LSTVQAKGYLQNYSNYLELDTDKLLISFADGLQKRRIENFNYDTSKKTTKIKSSSFFIWIRKFFTVDLFFGSVLIIGILAFLIWGTRNLLTSNNNENQYTETLPNVADVLVVTPEAIFEETPLALELETLAITQQATYTATPLFTPLPNEPKIQVVIIAIQDAWVKVSSDGELKYQGRITPGNAYTYNAENQLEIITGNAAALQILFNQEDIGILGLTGQVMSLVFNENGLIKPTEIITQTPTATIQSTSSTPTP
jgi:cytoskeletal protein RodZ